MNITHIINNNKIVITGRLELKKYAKSPEKKITIKDIEEYIHKNNIPTGAPISAPACASNRSPALLEAKWVYQVSKEYKKSLTQTKKPGKVNTRKKNSSSPRARARKIVSNRKTDSRKNESNSTKSTRTNNAA